MRSSVLKSNGGKGSAHKSREPLKWIEKIIIQRDEGKRIVSEVWQRKPNAGKIHVS
jgi:hypothetical protein|nr:MAG TPA: hypothetical protein [Bacteriophage sp.]